MKVGYSEVVAFCLAALAIRTSCELLKEAGRAVFQGAIVSLTIGVVGIGNILVWRHLEEQHLETSCGEAYRSCRAKTWF